MRPVEPTGHAARVAIGYAPARARPALSTLLALDEHLAATALATRDATLTAIRLAWWRDALAGLGAGPDPADPLLRACRDAALDPATLATIAEGWDAAVEADAVDADAHARARGGSVFALAAGLLGVAVPPDADAGWALADLAGRLGPAHGAALAAAARLRIDAATARPWPRVARPLGVLMLLGEGAARHPGAPRRRDLAVAMAFAATGRVLARPR